MKVIEAPPTNASFSRSVTRGQLAAALYRMAGEPAVTAKAAFTDVPADYWCAAAITWAAENGVVTGYGDGGFRPADAVQRQEPQPPCSSVSSL